jgi:hypothetical protein
MLKTDLKYYDHFYFFRAFPENLPGELKPDKKIEYSPTLYEYYTKYLKSKLDKISSGTRLARYDNELKELPQSYFYAARAVGDQSKPGIKKRTDLLSY